MNQQTQMKEVSFQTAQMQDNLVLLESRISDFLQTLTPVLSEQATPSPDKSAEKEPSLCPLAIELRGYNKRLIYLNQIVYDFLSRIQV